MVRKKADVAEDTMILCRRCDGNGNIGQRNGQSVNCPSCGGDGRVDPAEQRRFEYRTQRRQETYGSDIDYSAGADREVTTLPLGRLQSSQTFVDAAVAGTAPANPNVGPGRVLVRPIPGGTSQQFEVIGGHDALRDALVSRDRGGIVPVEVIITETGRGFDDAVDLTTWRPNNT